MKRITKKEWLFYGGFANPLLVRKSSGGRWTYWMVTK